MLARLRSRVRSCSPPYLARAISSVHERPVSDPSASPRAKMQRYLHSSFASTPYSPGETHSSYGVPKETVISLTSLGNTFAQKKTGAHREIVRKAVVSAVKKVRDLGEGTRVLQTPRQSVCYWYVLFLNRCAVCGIF